ncbi:protein tweety homolog 2 isoform X2 [Aythya fuligula]|uniref:Protein tweety homolog n=1 Tax=Aythya fuligula TaxID=219594 RepID=A0A6J3DWV3_AYTFU|nr:protein tweety homolog 2 isoform X2 [Aythya fuligula]
MPPSRADYLAPWWAAWLHGVPHRDLRLQPVPAAFRPRDPEYQQSLLFLGLVAAVCLGLNLLFLTSYLLCLCCCKRDEEPDTKRPHACCVTWVAVTAGLICCTAVGIGFYGNSETNDGVYQLLYALDNANHTLTGIDALVAGSTQRLQGGLEQHLGRLSEVLAPRADYLQTLKFLQQLAAGVVLQLSGLPSWHGVSAQLTALAARAAYVEYYRWLAYLLFFILVLTVCLLGCLGLAKRSRCLLAVMLCCGLLTLVLSWASTALDAAAAVGTSDFCVAPDKFIMNQTESEISAEVAHYYLYCEQSLSNPFQQALTVFQRSLTTMQIQTQGLIQFALPLFPTAEKDLLGVQQLLNASETSLHQLTAMLDCRGLHKDYLDALIGICYDGVEGLLYLVLFSLLVAASFSTIICAAPPAWKHLAGRDRDYDDMDEEDPFNPQARRIAAHNPARGQLRSFCSYSSSLGSQSSLHPPTQTISNAPVSEYMNQAVLFGGNPRYENVPLIGRGSPPPTYSPSMRATYLSVTDEHVRPFNTEFPA